MTRHSKAIGAQFEALACSLLRQHRCRILHTNQTYRDSELDIIALDKHKHLLFVEVRYRTAHGFGSAAESITAQKMLRIRKAAQHFLQANPRYQKHICRFDVITFDSNSRDAQTRTDKQWLEHANWIQGAFC